MEKNSPLYLASRLRALAHTFRMESKESGVAQILTETADRLVKTADAVQHLQRAYINSVPGGNKEMDTAMIKLAEAVGGFKVKTLEK